MPRATPTLYTPFSRNLRLGAGGSSSVPRFLFGRRTAARWKVEIGINGCIPYFDGAVIADGHGEDVPARLEALGIPRRQ